MPMLSVVLTTHNEEKNIARCLTAVSDIADEIIVVDGESSDETVKITKSFKATVFVTTNKANFHINKQIAMDKAQGDLVLQLDADEVVDQELKSFIKKIKSESTHQDSAWWISRKNYFLGKFLTKGGQYPDRVIRLYVNGQARLPQRDVHEQMQVDGTVGLASGHLVHYANPTFADYLRKFNTYTSFKAGQLQEQKLKVTLFNSLNYLLWKPLVTWFSLFIRHKGFVDGTPGFVFALFSGLHHAIAYLKLWEIYETKK